MNINAALNNEENIYYGHGIGTDSPEITNSIIKNGLRCSHGSLYYTSVALGIGNHIEKEEIDMLKNWPHKNSKIIIIVSLPIKYKILDNPSIGTYNMADAAFYYIPNEKIRKEYDLTNSPYVMPEFIAGYYDANNDSFTPNLRYYEKLSKEKQEKLFKQVKQNYFNIIEEGCGIEEYQAILADLGYEFPLTKEEIIKYSKAKEIQDLLSKLGEDLLNKPLILSNGNKITAEKYLKEIVFPFIPSKGYIVLNTGAKIPLTHFIIECVMYDCQERYNGNFSQYMKENVNLEETNHINNTNKTEPDKYHK